MYVSVLTACRLLGQRALSSVATILGDYRLIREKETTDNNVVHSLLWYYACIGDIDSSLGTALTSASTHEFVCSTFTFGFHSPWQQLQRGDEMQRSCYTHLCAKCMC